MWGLVGGVNFASMQLCGCVCWETGCVGGGGAWLLVRFALSLLCGCCRMLLSMLSLGMQEREPGDRCCRTDNTCILDHN